jgi:hypothetical protein
MGKKIQHLHIADESGSIVLTVWGEGAAQLKPGDIIEIISGYDESVHLGIQHYNRDSKLVKKCLVLNMNMQYGARIRRKGEYVCSLENGDNFQIYAAI